jgi:hypothetical protein
VEEIVERALQVEVLGDILLDEAEVLSAEQMGNVVQGAREQVVHADDGMALREQPVTEVRAEEAGAAGHEGTGFGGHGYLRINVKPTTDNRQPSQANVKQTTDN